MALNLEQRKQIYNLLANETAKADRAFAKAKVDYHNASTCYGGSVEREIAAVLLSLREAQRAAAYTASNDYFDAYLKDAA